VRQGRHPHRLSDVSEVEVEMLPWVTGWELSDDQNDVRRCAEVLRRIGDRLVQGDLSSAAIRGLLSALRAAELVGGPAIPESERLPPFVAETYPWIGPSNYTAPPMRFHMEGTVLVGEVRCTNAYGGSTARVHGGVIAGLFDVVVATRSSLLGESVTARLVVDYLKPVPLNVDLRLEAEIDRIEKRKRVMSARLYSGPDLCAVSEAVMVAVDRR
jgi:acyl-coenzyme A thioesterase PaaI-like protein